MAQKIEELGQAKGNNKKKDEEDNNIPPPQGEAKNKPKEINSKARLLFEQHFRETFGADYYWTAKDAGAMSQLLNKLKFQRDKRKWTFPMILCCMPFNTFFPRSKRGGYLIISA